MRPAYLQAYLIPSRARDQEIARQHGRPPRRPWLPAEYRHRRRTPPPDASVSPAGSTRTGFDGIGISHASQPRDGPPPASTQIGDTVQAPANTPRADEIAGAQLKALAGFYIWGARAQMAALRRRIPRSAGPQLISAGANRFHRSTGQPAPLGAASATAAGAGARSWPGYALNRTRK